MNTKIKDLLQAALAELEQEDKPAWTLTRHLPGFRPLRDGEEWHRQDFTEDMLAGGWRPLLLGETTVRELDEYCYPDGPLKWKKIYGLAGEQVGVTWSPRHGYTFVRTRRPLPEPAKVVPWDFETLPSLPFEIRSNKDDHRTTVLAAHHDGVELYARSWKMAYGDLLIEFRMPDGKPCGKEVLP